MSIATTLSNESLDCFDGMLIYGFSGNLEKYNECKKRLDEWLDKEEKEVELENI